MNTNIQKEVEDETRNNDKVFDKTTEKGLDHGLFRSSMSSIRKAHFKANRLRAGLVLAGLFTDKILYREVLTLFYVVTKTMEEKLQELANKGDKICQKIQTLGYHFTPQYEEDLAFLYSLSSQNKWENEVENVVKRSPVIIAYRSKIKSMTCGAELAGAVFVLWGALIIGGGAAVMPRIQRLFGTKEACHVFKDVVGAGRAQRKMKFIHIWDSLATKEIDPTSQFNQIVKSVQDCMQCNNDIFSSLQRNPWWFKYACATFAGGVSMVVYLVKYKKSKT